MKSFIFLSTFAFSLGALACSGETSGANEAKSGESRNTSSGAGGAGGAEQGAPPGVTCSDHPPCVYSDYEDNCDAGLECIIVRGCSAICITSEQACEETCRQGECGFQTSSPPSVLCETETVPGHD